MEDRPSFSRGHSDPTERSYSRPGARKDEQEAHATLLEDIPPSPDPAVAYHGDDGPHSTPATPRRHSGDGHPPKERQRVRFGPEGDSSSRHQPLDIHQAKPKKSNFLQQRSQNGGGSNSSPGYSPSTHSPSSGQNVVGSPKIAEAGAAERRHPTTSAEPSQDKPFLPTFSEHAVSLAALGSAINDNGDESPGQNVGEMAAQSARSRAERLSKSLAPNPGDRATVDSDTISPQSSLPPSPELAARGTTIPRDMRPYIRSGDLSKRNFYRDDTDTEDEDDGGEARPKGDGSKPTDAYKFTRRLRDATRRLLRLPSPSPSSSSPIVLSRFRAAEEGRASGYTTPEKDRDPEYVKRPKEYRKGMLSLLLDLYGHEGIGGALGRHEPGIDYYRQRIQPRSGTSTPSPSGGGSPKSSPPTSGQVTPKGKSSKFFSRSPRSSVQSLIQTSATLSAPAVSKDARPIPEQPPRRGSGAIEGLKAFAPKRRHYDEVHREIEELRARYEYMIKSCKALMRYGAPTHRLEEYMRKSARKLLIDGQFLYMPGCMIISFDSPETGTTDVKIVRENQGVDLSKLREMHDIYKGVIHSELTAQQANDRLDAMMKRKPLYNDIVRIFFYGIASASVGPFGFGGRPIDMPVAFLLGTFLGFLQLCLSAKSESYSNVFEISAAVLTSFAARGFGSINGGNTFCFSALAQSAIALILPGFIVLSAALELQSRSLIAGSVRMVYAIIYSLFLGFGITVGVAIYGTIDTSATQATICSDQLLSPYWKFLFVPVFTICLCVVNQAHWRQMPVMVGISFVGYIVNFFSAQRFACNAQVANTLGALAVGLLGNVYSRLYQGMSAAAILPAIFVQVPSGIAASGSLISGVASANQLLENKNGTGLTTVANGTQAGTSGIDVNSTVLNVGFTMIQIAIGLTVGLFFSSLIVYPFGKKRSGLFSF